MQRGILWLPPEEDRGRAGAMQDGCQEVTIPPTPVNDDGSVAPWGGLGGEGAALEVASGFILQDKLTDLLRD